MKDYPDINMFPDDRLHRILSLNEKFPTHIMVIVSPFDPDKSEEENVLAVHDLYSTVPGKQTSCDLIYGEAGGEGYGIIIFRPYPLEPTLGYCQKIVKDRNQPGLVVWSGKEAYFIAANGTKTRLPDWNKTVARLEEWCQHLKPGFTIQGIWNREMPYVHQRNAQLQGKFPKHHH